MVFSCQLITPWNMVFLERLLVAEVTELLLQNPENRNSREAHHQTISSVTLILSSFSHTSPRYVIIISHIGLGLGLQNGLFQ